MEILPPTESWLGYDVKTLALLLGTIPPVSFFSLISDNVAIPIAQRSEADKTIQNNAELKDINHAA